MVKFDKLQDSAVRVASGSSHVACITDAGEVWLWGDGRGGQLGYVMERSNNQPTPKKVENYTKSAGPIAHVACGQSHTLVLDVDGACTHTPRSRSAAALQPARPNGLGGRATVLTSVRGGLATQARCIRGGVGARGSWASASPSRRCRCPWR